MVGQKNATLFAQVWLLWFRRNGHGEHLVSQVGSFYYDWADVTLEVYSVSGACVPVCVCHCTHVCGTIYQVNSCDDFAQGPMTFSQMALHDRQGNDITSQAAWTSTGQTACGGKIHSMPTQTRR